MSVFVKDIDVPSDCDGCWHPTCNLWLQTDVGKRHKDCPISPMPEKHGPLIDRKELEKAVLKWLPPDPCGREEMEYPFETDICVSMMMEIEEQEIVVEAEGE